MTLGHTMPGAGCVADGNTGTVRDDLPRPQPANRGLVEADQ